MIIKNKIIMYMILFLSTLLNIIYFLFPWFLLRKYLFYIADFISNFSLHIFESLLFILIPLSLLYIIFEKRDFKYSKVINFLLIIIIFIWVVFFSYKLSMTNPDVSRYIYYWAYYKTYWMFDYLTNFSSSTIDSWVDAPILGILYWTFFKISNNNFIIFHILQSIIFLILWYWVYILYNIIYTKNEWSNLLILPLFLTTPFLFSQFYMTLADIPGALVFLYAIISIIYWIKKNKTFFILFSSILFILAFLTKYLMFMYILSSLFFIFIIYKWFRLRTFITWIISISWIISWIFFKPISFRILIEKVLFENNSVNNSLLGNISFDPKKIIIIVILLLISLIFWYIFKDKFVRIINIINNSILQTLTKKSFKYYLLLFILFSLFINFWFDKKVYFHRSYFVWIWITYVLFLFYYLKQNKFHKEEVLILLLYLVSFFTPNLMFKYLIPLYPFIIIIWYRFIISMNNKLPYSIIIINIFIIITFIIPQINLTYWDNFVKSTNFLEKNNIKWDISIWYLWEDTRHIFIRAFDFSILPYFYIYNYSYNYSLIDMWYSTNDWFRPWYKVDYWDNRNIYNSYYKLYNMKDINKSIEDKDTIILVINNDITNIDKPSKVNKNKILDILKKSCYVNILDTGVKVWEVWNSKTLIFIPDKNCK